jgi:hypothetical protein
MISPIYQTQGLDINPYIYSQLVFSKIAQTIQQGNKSLWQMVLEKLDIHMYKN